MIYLVVYLYLAGALTTTATMTDSVQELLASIRGPRGYMTFVIIGFWFAIIPCVFFAGLCMGVRDRWFVS